MNIKKTPTFSKKTKIIVGLGTIVLAALIIGAFFYFNRDVSDQTDVDTKKGVNSIDYGPASTEQQQAGDRIEDPDKANSSPSYNPVPQENNKSQVSVTVASWNQDDQYFRVSFDISTVDNTGTCILTLTKDDVNVRREAGVQALASSSTCKGFSIPLSELSAGQWKLALVYENSSLTGAVNQAVDIK